MNEHETNATRDNLVRAVDGIVVTPGPGRLVGRRSQSPSLPTIGVLGLATALVIGLAIALGPRMNNSVIPAASPSPTSTPAATASARSLAFPDLPLVIGTDTGDVYTRLVSGQPAGAKVHICDGIIDEVLTSRELVLARSACGGKASDTAWYLWDTTTTTVTRVVTTGPLSAAFADAGSIVYVRTGTEEPGAPIAMTTLILRDLSTGAETKIDERYVVANDLRLTGEGITVWRAKVNPNTTRTDAEAGTWLLRGTSLVKFSQDRLIASVNGVAALETEPQQLSTGCCSVVYVKVGSGAEQRLTPVNDTDEHVLAVLEDGRIVTWRSDGHVVIYSNGVPTRIDAGAFSDWRVLRSGDWLIAESAELNPSLLAYRISDGAFVKLPISSTGIHAIGMLPQQ